MLSEIQINDLIATQSLNIPQKPSRLRIETTHERSARCAADWILTIGSIKLNSFPSKPIDIRRLANLIAISPQGIGSKVISHDEENIRVLGSGKAEGDIRNYENK